jgi:hypothetical protein
MVAKLGELLEDQYLDLLKRLAMIRFVPLRPKVGLYLKDLEHFQKSDDHSSFPQCVLKMKLIVNN